MHDPKTATTLDDVRELIERSRRAGERVALATVINVDGSAPREEGAKMAISEQQKIAGSVSGGCVESSVTQEALDVLATGIPKIVRYGINRNMMWDVGLSCGGAIDVFIERLEEALPPLDPTEASATCTIVRGPNHVGQKMFVSHDRSVLGTLADVELTGRVAEQALELMQRGQSKTVAVDAFEVFIDLQIPKPRAILVGAVHIAVCLCRMATLAGFAVTVIDPRPGLCNHERFPDAANLLVKWPDEALQDMRIDENTYVAVLTHDEKFDDPTLVRVLPTHARYVGAIGSKKTQALRRERLREAGVDKNSIDRLRGPIGLDLGAQTPEEIAVAILAEMIAAKYHRSGIPLRDRVDEHIHA